MGRDSNISWCDHTFNIAWGCVHASPGCFNCYAELFAKRAGWDVWGVGKQRRTFGEKYWAQPLKWNAEAEAAGVRRRVLTSSMTDVFLNDPVIDQEREKLWRLIRKTPWLDWLVLTKHPERMAANLPDDWGRGYRNVWPGATVEDATAAWRLRYLFGIEAVEYFVSYEPAIGPLDGVDFSRATWMICGGESGAHRREMDLNWARSVRDRCAELGIPFFFKQSSGLYPGRGDTLDGVEHKAFPAQRQISDPPERLSIASNT